MSIIASRIDGAFKPQDRRVEALLRAGHIAGVLTIAVVLFASLYFFVLYIGST